MNKIRTLKDLQKANAEYAAQKEKEKVALEASAVEKPAKQPKKRKHLVVEESEWVEPVKEEALIEESIDEKPEDQGE